MSRRAIPNNSFFVVNLSPDQHQTYRTFPGIPVAVKPEPAGMVLVGSFVGVLGQPLQTRSDDHQYDGVIDFDKVLRDPDAPSRILPVYDSGDHVHPTDDGYKAMADAVDLSLFRKGEHR